MKSDILIGIDAGTSVIKSVAFSVSGEQLAVAAITNTYKALASGAVEQDMARTWSDTATSLKLLAEKIPDLAARVISIAVTGQGDGLWLIDKQGEPVAPAWLWLDSRSASIAGEFISSANYAAHYERTGTGLNACQMSTQLVWMHRNRPQVLDRAETAFHCKDWLYFNLTGHRATDPSEANFTFGDFRTGTYAPHILDQLGASNAKRLLPPIVDGTQEVHALSTAAASQTGLKAGTPVCLGFVDIICSGLGGGLFDPQRQVGCTIIGSTGMHMRMAPRALDVQLNAAKSGYTMPFPIPGLAVQIQSNMASTLNIDWLVDMAIGILSNEGIERSRAEIFKGLEERVLSKPAARNLYHPYISQAGERGPFMNPDARAMLSVVGSGHDFADLLRAVFEGICFAARDCYAIMGDMPREIRVTGGGARSNAMRTIFASVVKADIRTVDRDEAGASGAAMISAIQQKLYPNIAACVSEWVDTKLGGVIHPDDALTKVYDDAFNTYVETRIRMQPTWRSMSDRLEKLQPDAFH
jgi:erythritol kinase (D-erythritol 1-phosphate-forming)